MGCRGDIGVNSNTNLVLNLSLPNCDQTLIRIPRRPIRIGYQGGQQTPLCSR